MVEIVADQTPAPLPSEVQPETKFYTIGNNEGLHMRPGKDIVDALERYKEVEAFLKVNASEHPVNMKDRWALLVNAPKGTPVSIEVRGKKSERDEVFMKLEALEEEGERIFLVAGEDQDPSATRSEVRADQKEQIHEKAVPDEKRFLALIEEILDPAKMKGRNKHEWVTLHRRFFVYFIKDIEGSTEKSPAKNARMAVFRRFYGAEQAQNPLLKGVRKDSALEQAYRLKDELSSYYAAKVSTGHARENLFGLAKWTFLQITSQVARSLVGEEAEAVHSSPVRYEPLNSALLPTDYLEKFRDWLRYHNKKENFLYEPGSMVPGYFQMGESTPKNPKEAFAMNSVLALKFAGFEPSIRPFPEFARALVENGVESVEFISPHRDFPEMSPPAFYIRFKKPLVSPAGEEYPGIAVAVFQNPLPDLAIENSPDLNEVKLSDGDQEWSKLLGLTFTEKVPIEEQILKLEKLLDLAFEGRLLPRTDYTYFSGKGAARLAAFMGRTAAESRVLERDFNLVLEKEASAKDLKKDKFYREPVTPQIEKETRRNFEKWSERAILFDEFGASDAAFEKGAAQRVDIIRNREGLKRLYAIPYYRPLTDLIFARQGDQWLMDQRENGPYAKRLNELAPLLLSSYSLIEGLKGSFEESKDGNAFAAALLLQIAQALPFRQQRQFDKTKSFDLRKELIDSAKRHFVDDLEERELQSENNFPKISVKSREDFEAALTSFYHSFRRIKIRKYAVETAEKLSKAASLEAKKPLIESALDIMQLPEEEWAKLHEAFKPLAEELAGFMLSSVQEDLSSKQFDSARSLIQKFERILRRFPEYRSLAEDAKTSLHAAEEAERKKIEEAQKDNLPEYRRKAIEIREKYDEVFAANPQEYRVMAALVNQLADTASLDSAELQK
ncbi:MAG TPA: HPr family phosphocarrier protein, partial [bacterium]|nr:HPr family phosphocarrier protein [bacterium]